jgi:hypothetical protein
VDLSIFGGQNWYMQNLYDILGVTRNASNKDINAALRKLVRRYNEETAHGALDSAEALKFVNHARFIFVDPQRRAKYDSELAAFEAKVAGTKTLADQQATAAPISDDIQWIGVSTNQADPTPPNTKSPPKAAPAIPLTPAPKKAGPNLERESEWLNINSVLAPMSLKENAGKMTFMGTAFAESNKGLDLGSILTSGGQTKRRSTAPNPGLRLAARLIDYGLWGIILGLLLNFLGNAGTLSAKTVQILANPFVAAIIITMSWAFIEALLLIYLPVTPGKFLLDIRVAANVSNPYAYNDPGALLSASFWRAFRVWWRGLGGGVIPICLFTLMHARKKLVTFKETTWDFDSDCLVTHGDVGMLRGAIAAILGVGVVWLYGNHWITPFWQTVNAGWHYAAEGASAARDTWKTVRREQAITSKGIPTPPAKENRTIELEKTAQELIDKRDWKDLSAHCLAWTQEDERNVTAWFCYGRARHELADHTGAIAALKRASMLAPQNDDIRRLLKDTSLIEMQKKQLRMRDTTEETTPKIIKKPEQSVPDAHGTTMQHSP